MLAAAIVVLACGFAALDLWSRRAPELEPRHRAEALCFLLAHLLFMVSPVHAAMVGSDWSTTRSHGPSEEYPRGQ